jgi:subtilisin family serine protease
MRKFIPLAGILALTLSLAGCGDHAPDTVLAPIDVSASAVADSDAFYYYMGQRIPLAVDRSGVTVAVEGSGLVAARDAARAAGAPTATVVSMDHLPGQGVLRFAAELPPAALGRVMAAIWALPDVLFMSPLYRDGEGGEVRLWNRIIVEFEPDVLAAEAEALLDERGVRILRRPDPDSARFSYWVAYPPHVEALAFAAELYRAPGVRYAEPDRTSESDGPLTIPSDPYYGLQWHLSNTNMLNGVQVDANVEPVWVAGNKGGGVPSAGGLRIAVIDDGVDASHWDLEVPTWSAYDVFGRQGSGCTDCATNPRGNDTHGTSVAGIATALHNGTGVAGVAPHAQLVAIRIYRCTYPPFCHDNLGTAGQVADAIDWAWHWAMADVLNNSWRWQYSDAIRAAILRALSQGRGGLGSVVVFAAATHQTAVGAFSDR